MAHRPDGFHALTPHIVVFDAAGAIDLYSQAFGATEDMRMSMPGSSSIMHACIAVGDSKMFLCDENPDMNLNAPTGPGQGSMFYLYVEDADATHAQAVKAGMSEISAPTDMFYGDRLSVVGDPYGHRWQIATKKRDVSPQDMAKAMEAMAG